MNEIMETAEVLTPEKQQAVELHRQIMINGQMAAASFVEFCKGLKRMRDSKLYLELGYDNFDDYTSEAVGLQQRQAYSYISSLENLGEGFLQSNAKLGISRLSLLVSVPPTERAGVMEQNDLGGMTVQEIRELVKKYTKQGEQLALLTAERDEALERAEQAGRLDELKEKYEQLQREHEQLQNRPTEVAVQEPDQKTLDKIRKEAEKAAAAKLEVKKQKEIDAAVKAAKEAAAKETEEKLKSGLSAVESEKQKILERAAELEKKLSLSSNPETLKFNFYFEELQGSYAKLTESLSSIRTAGDTETADKLQGAMLKYLDIVRRQFQGM